MRKFSKWPESPPANPSRDAAFLSAGVAISSALASLRPARTQANSSSTAAPASAVFAHTDGVEAIAIAPDDILLATASRDSTIKLWSLPDGRLLKTLSGHAEAVTALAITPDGRLLASGSDDDQIKLWSLPDGNLLKTIPGHTGNIQSLAIASGGTVLASGSDDRTVKLWSLPDGVPIRTLSGHADSVEAVRITPDGSVLASGSWDNTIKLWSITDGKPLVTLLGHSEDVEALAITPDGRVLISGSADDTIKLWSLPDGRLLQTLTGHSNDVETLAVSLNGRVLVSGSGDNSLKLWSLGEERALQISRVSVPFPDPDTVVPVLHWEGAATLEAADDVTGPWMTAANQTRPQIVPPEAAAKFYRLRTEASLLRTMNVHRSGILATAITPDGRTLISGDSNGAVVVSNLPDGVLRGYLFDPAANRENGVTYESLDPVTGLPITYTLPCGSPVPPNATCVCNCVQGTRPPPSGGGGGCAFIVCTCNRIFIPSDRALKSDFSDVDPHSILERLASLPIQQWRYQVEHESVRHIGPMAQDFAAAFGVGADARVIHAVDAHGVTFAAIQALHELVRAASERIVSQQSQIQDLRQRLEQFALYDSVDRKNDSY